MKSRNHATFTSRIFIMEYIPIDLNAFKSPSTIYDTTCMSTSWASCCQSLSTFTFSAKMDKFFTFQRKLTKTNSLTITSSQQYTMVRKPTKDFDDNRLSKLELDDLFFRPSFSHKKRVICYLFYKTCSRQQHRLESPSTKQRQTFESINIKSNTFFFNQRPYRNVLKRNVSQSSSAQTFIFIIFYIRCHS